MTEWCGVSLVGVDRSEGMSAGAAQSDECSGVFGGVNRSEGTSAGAAHREADEVLA